MNAGTYAIILVIISTILLASGWGESLKFPGFQATYRVVMIGILVLFLFRMDTTFDDIRLNVGGIILPFFFTLSYLLSHRSFRHWTLWAAVMLTMTSVLLIMFSVVPRDPAIFILSPQVVYILIATLLGIVLCNENRMMASVIMVGSILATCFYQRIVFQLGWAEIQIPDAVTRDLMMMATFLGIIGKWIFQIVIRFVFNRVRRPAGKLEGDRI